MVSKEFGCGLEHRSLSIQKITGLSPGKLKARNPFGDKIKSGNASPKPGVSPGISISSGISATWTKN
jgi:hypothetical protein